MKQILSLNNEMKESFHRGYNELFKRKYFYCLLLQNVEKTYSNHIPTACVSLNKKTRGISLIVSDWFFKLTPQEKAVVLEHEMLHLAFDHFYFGYLPNKELMNIAGDLSINSWLQDDYYSLFGKNHTFEGIKLLFPSDYDLSPKESLLYYYNILSQEKDKKDNGQDYNKKLDPLLNDSEPGFGDFEPFEGTPEEAEIQKVLVDSIKKGSYKKLSEGQRGNYPELTELAKEWFTPVESKVNWKRELRKFIGKSEKKDYRKTYTRLNKRFSTSKGKKSLRKSKIAFIVDQSGSMDNESVEAGFNEIYHVFKQGHDVLIVEADTGVANHYLYNGKPIKTRSACGGTYMSPAITFSNTFKDINAVIVFTDGYIESNPVVSKLPLLWVVTKDGSTDINSPHKIIQVN
jgi:predicted metal-dependent peptidase